MEAFPHIYTAVASAEPTGNVMSSLENGCTLEVAPPAAFDGPGVVWSPEDLLMAAVADCLVLSFRAIARASHLRWLNVECSAEGQLEKVERQIKFTHVHTCAKLTIASPEDSDKAKRLLEKAEKTCLITNSLSAETVFSCEIVVG
jgi:organic hydroperoxide reductase OsmC/OhrA